MLSTKFPGHEASDLDRHGRGLPLLGRGDAAFLAEDEDRVLLVGGADVNEFLAVEVIPGLAQHLAQDKPAVDVADGEAVRLGRLEELIRLDKAARAGDVLHDHRGIARDMFPEVAGNEPCPQVEASARRKTDRDAHGLALVKRGRSERGRRDKNSPHCQPPQKMPIAS